ncbi:hypothetical protein BMS3Abin10_00679 [bacterium BMS3Abin10]|nr:hypothetical protein BMS3Abin10_00679 [bacterium BMS3Abin10]GBE38831.1 hypothetical protein BMS3Bbin08_01443 [bacterium BMS3Bbin08]
MLLLSALVVYVLYPTDENRIRKIISNCGQAIISEDIDGLMGSISYNYLDDYGNSYLWLKTAFQRVFEQLSDIKIEKNIIAISVNDDFAEVELSARVLASRGEEKGYIIGDPATTGKIKVSFEKTANKWLITKTEGVFDKNPPAGYW